jgi:pimeloyl-ACP methyl ester carboxylesterase
MAQMGISGSLPRIKRGIAVALLEEPQLVYLPLWREAFCWIESLRLKASPLYYGFGVPHGKGAPVIVVPGLFACDIYLLELRLWLNRIGYNAKRSRIGVNAECPDILAARLLRSIDHACDKHGEKVHIIGHSLGGVIARGVAAMVPEKVASVITLASPLRGVRVNPFVNYALTYLRRRVAKRRECPLIDCFAASCDCQFPKALKSRFPSNVRQAALYCKRDGVVDWETCLTGNPKMDFEVEGTHIGMVWNVDSYRIIANRLAGG